MSPQTHPGREDIGMVSLHSILHIRLIVALLEEGQLAVLAALGNMVGISGGMTRASRAMATAF